MDVEQRWYACVGQGRILRGQRAAVGQEGRSRGPGVSLTRHGVDGTTLEVQAELRVSVTFAM